MSREAKAPKKQDGKNSMGITIPCSIPYWARAAVAEAPHFLSPRGMSRFSAAERILLAAWLNVLGRVMWRIAFPALVQGWF